ncbi:hypothetical protein [Pseudomonas sp.]|uniref:capsid assembly protein n=1 Tax=Pseudomonas sp. TaxID=306 RepID=UPI0026229C52|nr:hypothetical protein [Pseudomonas sp.]
MTDIYSEFGVNNAVMSSSDPEEHEQNMLALDVRTRDGDDELVLNDDQEGSDEEHEESEEEQEESAEEEESGEESSEEEEEGGEESTDDFTPLGEPDADLLSASAQIDQYAEGFESLQAQAVERGLDPAVAQAIIAEVDEDGEISEANLKALEAVGYTRQFVQSYIKGQEAITQAYANSIVQYAGGKAQFDAIIAHLEANNKDAVETLYGAIERQDLATVRTVINLGMAGRTKKFGQAPQRNLSKRAPASAPRADRQSVQGFESKSEMTKAMSDKRYGRDAAYTQSVEQKVWASNW